MTVRRENKRVRYDCPSRLQWFELSPFLCFPAEILQNALRPISKRKNSRTDIGDGGSNSDFDTRVTLLGQLTLEELVQLSVEDTVRNELAALGDRTLWNSHLCEFTTRVSRRLAEGRKRRFCAGGRMSSSFAGRSKQGEGWRVDFQIPILVGDFSELGLTPTLANRVRLRYAVLGTRLPKLETSNITSPSTNQGRTKC